MNEMRQAAREFVGPMYLFLGGVGLAAALFGVSLIVTEVAKLPPDPPEICRSSIMRMSADTDYSSQNTCTVDANVHLQERDGLKYVICSCPTENNSETENDLEVEND